MSDSNVNDAAVIVLALAQRRFLGKLVRYRCAEQLNRCGKNAFMFCDCLGLVVQLNVMPGFNNAVAYITATVVRVNGDVSEHNVDNLTVI